MFDIKLIRGLSADDTGDDFQRISGENSRAGLMCFIRAFTVGDVPGMKYRYTKPVQDRFGELITELMQLVMCGGREVNPDYEQHLAGQKAKKDHAVQALIKKSSRKTPIRGK